jgi:hypothetical protein
MTGKVAEGYLCLEAALLKKGRDLAIVTEGLVNILNEARNGR